MTRSQELPGRHTKGDAQGRQGTDRAELLVRGVVDAGSCPLNPQLERVRLERPSRARPKDITHKAPRGRLRDLRGCQKSELSSSLFPPNSIVPKGDVEGEFNCTALRAPAASEVLSFS